MPRELRAVAPGKVALVEYDLPDLAPDRVRVETRFGAAKHGTELAFFTGQAQARGPYDPELRLHVAPKEGGGGFGPHTVGNMFVGDVIEAGSEVREVSVGDRVLGYGGFREVQTVAASGLWPMPADLSWKSAVCLDPADFAMAAVRDGHVRIGDAVAVFGMGAIGLMVVQFAKLAGAQPIIAVDPLPNRREAATACGADLVLDPASCDPGLQVRLATGKRGADVVIEFSGSVHALQQALRAVAFGGNVVAGAFPAPYGPGLGAEAHVNIPNLIFSRACSEPNREHPRWTEQRIYATCWRLICQGRLTGEPIVTPVVPFAESPSAYLRIAESPETCIKLGVAF
jgi:threonine dehydrogenase-like Zn-dependent dehydrogenase